MNEDRDLRDFDEEAEEQPAKELEFFCPNCGEKHQDEVVFLFHESNNSYKQYST